MNPELTKAITERLALGHTRDMIRSELLQAGYDGTVVDTIISEAQSPVSNVAATGEIVPFASDLFLIGWQFAKRNYALIIFLAIPMLLLEVATYLQETSQSYAEITAVFLGVGSIVMLALYFLLLTAALRLATIDDGTTTHSLRFVWGWATKHVWGLLWVLLLSTLVIMGGFFLFIVPGIILSFLLYLAQYVYAVEGTRGLGALLRSRELVQGYWWLLLRRLLMLLFFFFLAMLGVGIVTGVVAIVMGTELLSNPTGEGEFIFNLLGQILSAVATIMGVKIGMVFYQSLAAERPAGSVAAGRGKGMYVALAWLGLFGLVTLVGLVIAAVSFSISTLTPSILEESNEAEMTTVDAKQRAFELRTDDAVSPAETTEPTATETESQW